MSFFQRGKSQGTPSTQVLPVSRLASTAHSQEADETICQNLNGVSPVAQTVKTLPTMQKTQVQSLGGEEPLEEQIATHCSILAWRIPTDRGAWRATVHGLNDEPECNHLPSNIQFSSVAQSCQTLCDPKNHSTPGFPDSSAGKESTAMQETWV